MCNMELRFDLRFASRVAVARWPERSSVADGNSWNVFSWMFPGRGEIVSTRTYNNSPDESLILPRYSRHFPIFRIFEKLFNRFNFIDPHYLYLRTIPF